MQRFQENCPQKDTQKVADVAGICGIFIGYKSIFTSS